MNRTALSRILAEEGLIKTSSARFWSLPGNEPGKGVEFGPEGSWWVFKVGPLGDEGWIQRPEVDEYNLLQEEVAPLIQKHAKPSPLRTKVLRQLGKGMSLDRVPGLSRVI